MTDSRAIHIQKNGTGEPLFQGRNRDTEVENGYVDTTGKEEVWGKRGNCYTFTAVCEIDS